jgi:hypothetical protein
MNKLVEVTLDFDSVKMEWHYRKNWYVIAIIHNNRSIDLYGKLNNEEFSVKDNLKDGKQLQKYVAKFKKKKTF